MYQPQVSDHLGPTACGMYSVRWWSDQWATNTLHEHTNLRWIVVAQIHVSVQTAVCAHCVVRRIVGSAST